MKSDFLSILPVELGNDPMMADKLVMIPIRETLPGNLLPDSAARYATNAVNGFVNHLVSSSKPSIVSLKSCVGYLPAVAAKRVEGRREAAIVAGDSRWRRDHEP